MEVQIPENCNPFTREKYEEISSYDQFEGAMTDLNQAFHESYNNMIHHTYEKLGKDHTPVIVMFHDEVILFFRGEQETVNVIPELYHKLKAIGHVSFGIFVTLADNGYGQLRDDIRASLEKQRSLIERGISFLDVEPLPIEYGISQRGILESALEMINNVLEDGAVSASKVIAFARQNAPRYLQGAAIGAQLEIDELHKTVMRWKDEMGETTWENVHVVVCAAHQGRYREATLQYFQRLLGEEEGQAAEMEDRVVYAEHINDPRAAMDLLARHMVDQRASVALFGNRTRLQRDLMADGAKSHLMELLPE